MPEQKTTRELAVALYERTQELERAHRAAEAAARKLANHLDGAGGDEFARFHGSVLMEARAIGELFEDSDPAVVVVDARSLLDLIELADTEPAVPETATSRV